METIAEDIVRVLLFKMKAQEQDAEADPREADPTEGISYGSPDEEEEEEEDDDDERERLARATAHRDFTARGRGGLQTAKNDDDGDSPDIWEEAFGRKGQFAEEGQIRGKPVSEAATNVDDAWIPGTFPRMRRKAEAASTKKPEAPAGIDLMNVKPEDCDWREDQSESDAEDDSPRMRRKARWPAADGRFMARQAKARKAKAMMMKAKAMMMKAKAMMKKANAMKKAIKKAMKKKR